MAFGFLPSHPSASETDAHAVRPLSAGVIALPTRPRPHEIEHQIEDHLVQIIAALTTAPIRSFDLSTAAVISGPCVEGRVCIRLDGASWSLATLDAAVLALLLRLETGLRGADLFAEAFNAAIVQAEAKVEAVHAWSGRVRPTEGDEG